MYFQKHAQECRDPLLSDKEEREKNYSIAAQSQPLLRDSYTIVRFLMTDSEVQRSRRSTFKNVCIYLILYLL